METIEKSIEVNCPVRTVYDQWTQFEDFPHFMEGVKSVKQLDDKRLHWEVEIAGKKKEWDSEIVIQDPDQRISWRSMSGPQNRGTVSFKPLGADKTHVALNLSYEPEGMMEKMASSLGLIAVKVESDLKRFKQFIELKGASAGWRGEIHGSTVTTIKET